MINTMNEVFFWIKVNEEYVVFSKYKMQPFLIKNYKGDINKIFNNFELQFSPNKQDQIKSQRKFCYIGFNPTDICNMNCKYCFKSNRDDKNKIQIENLKKSIKEILNLFSDCNDEIQIEISGGEPRSSAL